MLDRQFFWQHHSVRCALLLCGLHVLQLTVLPFVCSWFVLERALMEIQVLGRRFAVDFVSAACDVQVACAYYTLEKV